MRYAYINVLASPFARDQSIMQKLSRTLYIPLLFVLAACGAAVTPTATPSPTTIAESESPRIAMVVSTGTLDDGGFNQLTYIGMEAASRRFGASLESISATQTDDDQPIIEELAAAGYDIIVTVGFVSAEATRAVALNYPETHFIGIDQFQVEPMPNVTGIIFPEDQAGYLAGVLAANLSKSGTVAGIYASADVPPVFAFSVGFENGAKAANPDIKVITQFYPGDVLQSFSDLEWGRQVAEESLTAGADVIFTAAGDTGRASLVAYANANRNDGAGVYCIGVDTDQWLTVPEAHPCLVSSAAKGIPQAVDDVIEAVLGGNPPSGNYPGPVGLAEFHDFDAEIPDTLKAELEQLAADLINGNVSTGSASGE